VAIFEGPALKDVDVAAIGGLLERLCDGRWFERQDDAARRVIPLNTIASARRQKIKVTGPVQLAARAAAGGPFDSRRAAGDEAHHVRRVDVFRNFASRYVLEGIERQTLPSSSLAGERRRDRKERYRTIVPNHLDGGLRRRPLAGLVNSHCTSSVHGSALAD
jgi:hypothetical protein